MHMLSPAQAAIFRRLTIGDRALLASTLGRPEAATGPMVDRRTASLARVAALVMADAAAPAYQIEVRSAVAAGASIDEITAVLLAVAPICGSALLMSAAPKLALALGYDVEGGLEDEGALEADG